MTAAADVNRGGLIATFVSQASIVPELPRVVIGIARQHFTWQLIEQTGAFALHLLGDEHLPWVWRFGLRSGRQGDKLDGIASRAGKTGSPILPDALAWLEARVEGRLDTGDRDFTSVSFLIDCHGVIRHIHPGGQYIKGDKDYAEMKSKIEELLAEK